MTVEAKARRWLSVNSGGSGLMTKEEPIALRDWFFLYREAHGLELDWVSYSFPK